MIKLPTFETRKQLLTYLASNKASLIAQKKAAFKYADAVTMITMPEVEYMLKGSALKANEAVDTTLLDVINTSVVINSCNLRDSHKDVHLEGLWDKSLNETKFLLHLQEHQMAFDKIIADGGDLKAITKSVSWADLGYLYTGQTQCLVFNSVVKRKRNKFMFEQYANGYVRNHSVGMQYVSLVMCINDDEFGAEYEAWQKYFPLVVNKQETEEDGYFWGVKEAKVKEGSAVPLGSNMATPTLDNNAKEIAEPETHSVEEPPKGTPQIDYSSIASKLNLC